MKVVIYSLIAMVCYAVANVMLELKFAQYKNTTLMVCYGGMIAFCGFILRQATLTNDPAFAFPTGKSLVLIIMLGVIFAAADYFYVGAYTMGGKLLTITSITVMFPIFASIIKICIAQRLPNVWQVSGCLIAIFAVLLVTKGNAIDEAKTAAQAAQATAKAMPTEVAK